MDLRFLHTSSLSFLTTIDIVITVVVIASVEALPHLLRAGFFTLT